MSIRRLYPFVLMLEMTLVPTLLAVQPILKVSLYAVLAVEVVITLYVSAIPLYLLRLDNIRNYIHRGIILSICIFQIATLNVKE